MADFTKHDYSLGLRYRSSAGGYDRDFLSSCMINAKSRMRIN